MPYRLYLCLAHSIPSPPLLMQHMHQPITKWYDPLYSITWPYWFIDLDFTCFSLLPSSIGIKVLVKLHRHVVHRSKASNLPFTLATSPSSQVMSWSFPPWSHDSMSCLICNELLHHNMCELCNISEPFPPPWHVLLTHMYLWTNHLCSHINTISPPRVVTQLPKPHKDLSISPFLVIDDNSTKIWKLSSLDSCCLPKQFYHVKMILDKYHKPKMVVLAPPTYVLECLFWSSHICIDWNCGRVITTKWC